MSVRQWNKEILVLWLQKIELWMFGGIMKRNKHEISRVVNKGQGLGISPCYYKIQSRLLGQKTKN